MTYRKTAEFLAKQTAPHLFQQPANSLVDRDRAVGFFPRSHHVWVNLDEFLSLRAINQGVHTVWHNGLPIDFEISGRGHDNLLVVFHGASAPSAILPIFAGRNVARGLDAVRISFMDPSLYLASDLHLGWHAGSSFQPMLQRVTAELIEKVASVLGTSRTVLFGSSGGGFAALIQAASFPGSTTVVANAQTDILKYHANHVERYLARAWGGDRNTFIAETNNSAIDRLKQLGSLGPTFFMQNSTDKFHIQLHLEPFISAFKDSPDFYLLMDDWGDGHVAPPSHLFHKTLEAVLANETDLVRTLGFYNARDYKSA